MSERTSVPFTSFGQPARMTAGCVRGFLVVPGAVAYSPGGTRIDTTVTLVVGPMITQAIDEDIPTALRMLHEALAAPDEPNAFRAAVSSHALRASAPPDAAF